MPNNEEHCRHTKLRYGVTGRDIHLWMDEPSELYGPSHRWVRHDAKLIPKPFADKYGKELARNIMIDHILLDKSGYGEYPHPTPEPFRWSDKDMISLFFIFGWMLSIIIAFTGIEPWPTPEQDRWFYSWIMISILCLIGVIFGGSFIKDESSVKPKVKAYSSAEEEGIDIELEEEEVLLYYDEEEELR